jgi:integrase/recombinase XerC
VKIDALLPLYLEAQQPSPSVVIVIRTSWPKFLAFCGSQGIAEVEDITTTVLEDFHKGLLWQPNGKGQWYKANSVDQFVRRVRQILHWCFTAGFIKSDPTSGLLLPRPVQPVPQPLTWQQLQTLLRAPDCSTPLGLRDALMLQILTESSLGLLQVVTLTEDSVGQLDLEATTWTLLATYLERARPLLVQFGGNLNEKALFLTRDGRPMNVAAAAARLNEIMKQTGLGRRLPSRLLRQSYQTALQPLRDRHLGRKQ